MKVAYINADQNVPVFGTKGSSVHVQEVMLALLKRGAEVHLFATQLGGEAPANLPGLHLHPLAHITKGDTAAREQAALATNHAIYSALESETEQGAFDLIYERRSLWSFAALEFAREHGLASVLEVNAPLLENPASSRQVLNREAAEDAAMRAFRSATVVSAVSRELAHMLEKHPSARGKVQVVPNAVNPERFAYATPTRPKDADDFVVGFVGTLKAKHGLTTLLESFTQLAQKSGAVKLLIVGDGPERERLDREIAAKRLSGRVHFTGAVSPDEVPGLLASMDVAVVPYPPLANFYHSPLKLYEYMAAGLPIVASRIGQMEEVIQDGVTGILVPPGSTAALTNALLQLQMNPAQRTRLGRAAQDAVQQHTWDDIVAYILSLAGFEPGVNADVASH